MKNFDAGKFLQDNGKYLLIISGIAFVYFAFFRKKKTEGEKDASDLFKELNEESKGVEPPLLSKSNLAVLADKIEEACLDVGTDEEAIFLAFGALKNKADLLGLISAFGMRQKYEFGIPAGKRNLSGFLTNELTVKEIERVNYILSSKGIDFRF